MDVIGTTPLTQSGSDEWWRSLPLPDISQASSDAAELASTATSGRGVRDGLSSLVLIQESKSRTDGQATDDSAGPIHKPTDALRRKVHRSSLHKTTGLLIRDALPLAEMVARQRLGECASYMMFREWVESGSVSLRAANFCNRVRLCPGCAHWSAVRTLGEYVPKIETVMRENGAVPLLFTFTVKDGPDLGERLGVLRDGLRLVGRRVSDARRGKGNSSFAGILGAVVRVEIKRGSGSKEWHPHAHGLVLRDRWQRFPLSEMQREWRDLVGAGNLDVRLTHSAKAIISGAELRPGALASDLSEVIKYTMKFGEMSPRDVVKAWQVCHGKRLALSWGSLYRLKEVAPGPDAGEFTGWWRDWSFRYDGGWRRYVGRVSAEGYKHECPAAPPVDPPGDMVETQAELLRQMRIDFEG